MTRRRRLAFWAVVAVQALALVALIGVNELALAGGEKVTLRTVPVDPVDLFRGRYVTLRYEITTVQVPDGTRPGDTIYVPLYEVGDAWQAQFALPKAPTGGTYVRGTVRSVAQGTADVEYGIETYFTDEGDARRLELAGQLLVTVVLEDDGRAHISRVEPVR